MNEHLEDTIRRAVEEVVWWADDDTFGTDEWHHDVEHIADSLLFKWVDYAPGSGIKIIERLATLSKEDFQAVRAEVCERLKPIRAERLQRPVTHIFTTPDGEPWEDRA